MSESIFTKIIKGEIPCYKIYEDDLTFAFLDIYPVQPGHTLVVPKKEVPFVWDMDDADYIAVMKTVKKIADRMKEVLDKQYVGVQVFGTDVPHAHVHVIPFNTAAEFRAVPDRSKEPDDEALKSVHQILKFT
jgi:histidine triad (HIT) family protein